MKFPIPSYHSYEEFCNRLAKLQDIKNAGIDPYPHSYIPTLTIGQVLHTYGSQELGHSDIAAEGKGPHVQLAGRLILFRPMGKNAFGHIQDETGKVQLMFNRDLTKVHGVEFEHLKWIEKKIDLGDILGVEGNLFRTQKGELTLFVKKMCLLCKSLLPLPDKHSGLVDKGVRYRKRWLDLIAHPEVTSCFHKRSRVVQYIREFLTKREFLEVETPVLQSVYGGANAHPFKTHLRALDQEMYLRISLEIPLKQLIIGGMHRVFEIGKVFRNEGIDRTHNPEFTELEVYAAYWDYQDMMVLAETLFEEVSMKLLGTTRIVTHSDKGNEYEIDLRAPWTRMSMKASILQYAGLDVDTMSDDAMRTVLCEKKHMAKETLCSFTRGELIALLFEQFVEEKLVQPHHIIDHPIETTPLCKPHRDPILRQQGFVERFETFICGQEFCNSYTELNDPELQRTLFLQQAQKKLEGDEGAHPLDEAFLEAICQGMPPTGGLGLGVDRMVMLLTQSLSIRDVILFPIMRPGEG